MTCRLLLVTASKEVEEFHKPEVISRVAIKRDGILYHKSRILEGQRFSQAGELEGMEILRSTGINVLTPVIDRWSPLAYAIGDHIHTHVAKHAGMETCFRTSHSFVHILKGLNLFKELADDCTFCKKIQKRFVEAAFGPVHPSKFTLTPPFWTAHCDLWGPLTVYVPGREKETRNSKALSSKVYAMMFVCVITKLINIQIVESKDVEGICDGLTRLSCEVGTPANLLIDQEASLMKSLREGEVDLLNIKLEIQRRAGVNFEVCPVQGHNHHGLVERKIKSAHLGLEKCGAGKLRLHATGAQSLVKVIENDLNNTPLGLCYGRSQTNTPLLKLLSPNLMRMGRINSRNPIGPFRLPSGPKSMMERVETCYKLWYREYQDTMMLKYLLELQPKWFKSDRDTKVGDVVYFRKKDGKLEGPWIIGIIDEVIRSRDGVIRRVNVRYHNANEDQPRVTDRCVRSIVRLFNIDEGSWKDDMLQVQKKLASLNIEVEVANDTPNDDIEEPLQTLGDLGAPEDTLIDEFEPLATASNTLNYLRGESVIVRNDNLLESGQEHRDLGSDGIENEDELDVLESCNCCCSNHHRFQIHLARPTHFKLDLAMPGRDFSTIPEAAEEDSKPCLDVDVAAIDECVVRDPFLACIIALETDLEQAPE